MHLQNVRLITCVGVEHDLPLLPHFIDHYAALGIPPPNMSVILNANDPQSAKLGEAVALASRKSVETDIWLAPYTSETMWEKRRKLQKSFMPPRQWLVSADVDEFQEYPEDLGSFLDRCERLGVDTVQGVFIDRLHPEGRLAAIAPDRPLMEQFPVQADVIGAIGGVGRHHGRHGTVKLMAFKGSILPARGGHDPQPESRPRFLYGASLGQFPEIDRPSYRFTVPTKVHHFHWTNHLRPSLEKRLATAGVSAAGKEYGRKQLTHIERHDGILLEAVATDAGEAPKRSWQRRLAGMRRLGLLRIGAYRLKRMLAGART